MEPEHELGDDIEGLAAKAMRPPMRLSAEDLVASELASAILSDPLSKIRHIGEGLMLLDESDRKQAGITEEETQEAKELYGISVSLLNAYIDKEVDPIIHTIVERYAMVPWSFPIEKADQRLSWLGPDFWGFVGRKRDVPQEWKEMSQFKKLYAVMSQTELEMESYRGAIIRFVVFAMPKAIVLMKKIIGLVSPDSYREALKILRGAKRGKA